MKISKEAVKKIRKGDTLMLPLDGRPVFYRVLRTKKGERCRMCGGRGNLERLITVRAKGKEDFDVRDWTYPETRLREVFEFGKPPVRSAKRRPKLGGLSGLAKHLTLEERV